MELVSKIIKKLNEMCEYCCFCSNPHCAQRRRGFASSIRNLINSSLKKLEVKDD